MVASILLIEDTVPDAERTKLALRRCGIHDQVIDAHDGSQALGILSMLARPGPWRRLGLIILDVHMLVSDGFDLLKRIRAMPRLHDVPVVVLAQEAVEADRIRALLLGVAACIAKVADIDEYCQHLHLALQNLIHCSVAR